MTIRGFFQVLPGSNTLQDDEIMIKTKTKMIDLVFAKQINVFRNSLVLTHPRQELGFHDQETI